MFDNLRKSVFEIFNYAKRNGMKTSLDPNWDPMGWTKERIESLIKILSKTNFFFPDYEEGKAITKIENPKKIVKRLLEFGPKIVALKCGKKGSYIGNKNEIFYTKGFKVNSIQATGAGDAFDAGFIKAFLSGLSLRECARFANAAGALYTTRFGAERFPKEEEIRKLLRLT